MGNDEIAAYFENAPENQREILATLRSLIHKAVPGVEETIKWGQPVFSAPDDFAYLKSTKKHINLGFFNYTELEDPDNLLEGSGKRMRHVKIDRPGDIKAGIFKQWFKTAAKR